VEKLEKDLYGKLAEIAKQYLATTATPVPSERLFFQIGVYVD
jgi:hypothetical protein